MLSAVDFLQKERVGAFGDEVELAGGDVAEGLFCTGGPPEFLPNGRSVTLVLRISGGRGPEDPFLKSSSNSQKCGAAERLPKINTVDLVLDSRATYRYTNLITEAWRHNES